MQPKFLSYKEITIDKLRNLNDDLEMFDVYTKDDVSKVAKVNRETFALLYSEYEKKVKEVGHLNRQTYHQTPVYANQWANYQMDENAWAQAQQAQMMQYYQYANQAYETQQDQQGSTQPVAHDGTHQGYNYNQWSNTQNTQNQWGGYNNQGQADYNNYGNQYTQSYNQYNNNQTYGHNQHHGNQHYNNNNQHYNNNNQHYNNQHHNNQHYNNRHYDNNNSHHGGYHNNNTGHYGGHQNKFMAKEDQVQQVQQQQQQQPQENTVTAPVKETVKETPKV